MISGTPEALVGASCTAALISANCTDMAATSFVVPPLSALPSYDWVLADLAPAPAPSKSPAPAPSKSPAPATQGPAQPAAPPPPATLVLSGELKDQDTCLGVYDLVAGATVHGSPVWRHVSRDRFIARFRDGTWLIQTQKNVVGLTDVCFMRFCDPSVALPHQSALVWEEFDSAAQMWIRAPVFTVREDASGELASLHLKRERQAEKERRAEREAQAVRELARASELAQERTLTTQSAFQRPTKGRTQPTQPKKKMMCSDCLADALKGGSRCFVCDPR